MSAIQLVVKREWDSFIGHDKGLHIVYVVLVLLWSLFLAFSEDSTQMTAPFFWLSFSIIAVSNFSQSVFVSERITGALEILLVCGVPRHALLWGKILFVQTMSVLLGVLCYGFSELWTYLYYGGVTNNFSALCLYGLFVFLNTILAAFFSIILPNPRFSHFISFLAVALCYGLTAYFQLSFWMTGILFFLLAIGVLMVTGRLYQSERIIKPVNL